MSLTELGRWNPRCERCGAVLEHRPNSGLLACPACPTFYITAPTRRQHGRQELTRTRRKRVWREGTR